MLLAIFIVVESSCDVSFNGDLKLIIFYKIFFFSAQPVSAERMSALFHLRKFCSTANLVFNCLACLPRVNFYRDIRKFKCW